MERWSVCSIVFAFRRRLWFATTVTRPRVQACRTGTRCRMRVWCLRQPSRTGMSNMSVLILLLYGCLLYTSDAADE